MSAKLDITAIITEALQGADAIVKTASAPVVAYTVPLAQELKDAAESLRKEASEVMVSVDDIRNFADRVKNAADAVNVPAAPAPQKKKSLLDVSLPELRERRPTMYSGSPFGTFKHPVRGGAQ